MWVDVFVNLQFQDDFQGHEGKRILFSQVDFSKPFIIAAVA